MNNGQLILISAPSGAGKTSLVNKALARDPNLVVAVSHTTRPRRGDEQDGVNYHFVHDDAFQNMVGANQFLEHAQVFGRCYGTSQAEVTAKQKNGTDVILEIDWQGADQVRTAVPNALSIFILPPSIETLRERLIKRGQDAAENIEQRLAEARLDIKQCVRYNYVITNDHFDVALEDLLGVIRSGRLRTNTEQFSTRIQTLIKP